MELGQLSIYQDGSTGIIEVIRIVLEIEHLVGRPIDHEVVQCGQEGRGLLENLGALLVI